MSDENLTTEELPIEDQKKAINLQDLVYVKKYIDESMDKKLEAEIPGMVADEMNEGYYTQAETDATFYKRTDTVANANHATSADNATQAVNANHATTADSATSASTAGMAGNAETANEAAHAINADKATEADHATNADYATNAGHATNATHSDSADEATNATNAINAVLKTDGSYAGLVIEEAVMKLNDGTTLYAESAVNADNAGKAEMATYAESANYAENAGYAESAGEVSNAQYAATSGHATNATNAVSKSDGTYVGLTIDENGILKFNDSEITLVAESAMNTGKKCICKSSLVLDSQRAGYIKLTEEQKRYVENASSYEVVWSLLKTGGGTYIYRESSVGPISEYNPNDPYLRLLPIVIWTGANTAFLSPQVYFLNNSDKVEAGYEEDDVVIMFLGSIIDTRQSNQLLHMSNDADGYQLYIHEIHAIYE